MAIESHKCNTEGCKGRVSFENADFDPKELETIKGYYAYTGAKCNECGKGFIVVPHWSVIHIDEKTGDFEEI